MRNKLLCKLIILCLLAITGTSTAQVGSSAANPYVIFPATSCGNTCGQQYCGNMQCPTGNCGSVTLAGSSGGLDPSCTVDDERTQSVMWCKVHATTTSFTINNGSPYVGPGAANANQRDYAVYSGLPGSLVQIACGSLAANASASISGLTAGAKYHVMISPHSSSPTALATNVCFTAAVGYTPSGNTCASATSLTTNVTYTMTNAGATPNTPICSGSIENEVWYRWCAPANWPVGQKAYVSVYNQICNSSLGLQLSVWNTGNTCPTVATDPTVICQNPGVTTPYYYEWVPVANQCYLMTIDGYAGTACEFRLTVGTIIVLPIELASFQVKEKGAGAEILWTTSSEMNNDYFTIERSKNGIDFEAIATVKGAGTSSVQNNYRSFDPDPLNGISYYRLKQTDFDGMYSYSQSVSFRMSAVTSGILLSPNPAMEKFTVYLPEGSSAANLTIHDVQGKVVVEQSIESGREVASVDVSTLQKGMYFVRIIGDEVSGAEPLVVR